MKSFLIPILALSALTFQSCSAESSSSDEETAAAETSELNIPDPLVNVTILYAYSGGNSYRVSMQEDGLRYQYRSGRTPEKWWGPFEYNSMHTPKGDIVVAWYEKGYGDYVTLVIDFDEMELIGSAIIPGTGGGKDKIHFEKATIQEVQVD